MSFDPGRVYLITLENRQANGDLRRDIFSGWWTGRSTPSDKLELLDVGFPGKLRFASRIEIVGFVPAWV